MVRTSKRRQAAQAVKLHSFVSTVHLVGQQQALAGTVVSLPSCLPPFRHRLCRCQHLVTDTGLVGYIFIGVSLFVSRITQKLLTKFGGKVAHGPRTIPLDFGGNPWGRPPQYAPPHPLQVDLWPFNFERGVWVICDEGYLCANFNLPSLSILEFTRQTDVRQIDVRRASSLKIPPPCGGVGITSCARGDTICPRPSPPSLRAAEQTRRSSTFPCRIRSLADCCSRLTR